MLAVLLVLVIGACSGAKPSAAPTTTGSTTPAPTTITPTSSTTSTTVRTSSTSVTSTTRTTLATVTIGPGDAFISGTVAGPAGPVDGATVHIERVTGAGIAAADVTTVGGGTWRMDSVLGGAYRIRAFKAPDQGQSEVEVFFLAANDRKVVNLQLAGPSGGQQILAIVNPNPPRVNQPAVVTVQLGSPRVDAQGRPTILPQVGTVLQLSVGAGMTLESTPQMATDAAGSASWRVRCLAPGPSSVSVSIAGGTASPVNLPPCTPVSATPAATTTTAPGR